MKPLAYICSYEDNEKAFLADIQKQKDSILKYVKTEDLEEPEFFYENKHSRNDYKPILLEIINNFYGKTDKFIVVNLDVISPNTNFREWVQDELARIGIELLTVSEKGKSATFIKAINLKNKIKSVPSQPEVVLKIIQTVQNKSSKKEELAQIIKKDAGFCAKVLKLANSEVYGFSKQINSVEKALEILGFTTIKGLVLSSEIFKVFAPQNDKTVFDYVKFWKHNLMTAFCADLLYELLHNKKSESIYTAAIMHDLGKIMLAQYDSANYRKVTTSKQDGIDLEANLEAEEKYCGVSHTQISALVAQEWNFPEDITDVMQYHHNIEESENFKEFCAIVNVSDIISNLHLNSMPLTLKFFNKNLLAKYKISETEICLLYNKLAVEISSTKNNIFC